MTIVDSPVSIVILVLLALFYLISLASKDIVLQKFSLNPFSVVHSKQFYQIVTHIFIHLDFAHLLFNGLTFYFFAPHLEFIIGGDLLLLIFLTSGIVASLPSIIKQKDNPSYYSLGASGAISGVVFSYILFFPTSRIYIFFIPIGIPAPIFAMLYLAYCYYAGKNPETKINHDAHFWGAVWGLVLTAILFPDIVKYFFSMLGLAF